MKMYVKAAADEQNKYKSNLKSAGPKLRADIKKLAKTLKDVQKKKDELKALIDSADIIYPTEEYDIKNPEDFEWFMDEKRTSDDEADEIYSQFDEAMKLVDEYDELADYLDKLKDALEKLPSDLDLD